MLLRNAIRSIHPPIDLDKALLIVIFVKVIPGSSEANMGLMKENFCAIEPQMQDYI